MKLYIFLLISIMISGSDLFAQAPDPNFHIYLCFGQSNMVGGDEIPPADRIVDSRFQVFQAVNCSNLGKTKGNWYTANPPLCRCYTGLGPVDFFGREMVANLPSNIRVGVILVAIEGASIELFDKYDYAASLANAPDWLKNIVNNDYGGYPYQYLVDLANSAKSAGVIKGILLHQGETNYGDTGWPSKVKGIYDDMMNDVGLNPASTPLLAGQLAGGDGSYMNSAIIATLPQVLPNAHIVSSNNCEVGPDGIHFADAGKRELGRRYATKMLSLLNPGGCNPTSITPYVQVNNGTWQQTSSVTISSGAQVRFGPQPVSGGSWSWSGCGTSGSSREQTVSPTGSCTATATYTNSCGAQSTQTFTVNVGGGGNTFNGVYSFVAQHSGKAIDVSGGGTSNGTNVQQWTYTASNNNENFQVTHLGSGWHRISPVIATGQALDVSGISTANGANIHTWQYLGGNNQQWRFESAGNGYWKMIARHSNKCLDVSGVSTADGANIHQWDCIAGAQNQAFQVIQNTSARFVLHDTEILSDPSDDRGFAVYPNPSTGGAFTINVSSDNSENYRLRIFTADGKKVYEVAKLNPGPNEISTGLAKGMYFIKVDGVSYFGYKKLMVK